MCKRILSMAIAVMLVMVLLMSVAGAYDTRYSCCSNGKPLNVRTGPGKEYSTCGSIPYGDPVGIDHDLGNGWSEIFWGSGPAYVMTSLLSRTDPGPYNPNRNRNNGGSSSSGDVLNSIFRKARFVTPYTVTMDGTRGSGSVNVRWAPSTDSTLIQTYAYGSTMQVIADLGDWCQVVDPITGITGFAMKKFLAS